MSDTIKPEDLFSPELFTKVKKDLDQLNDSVKESVSLFEQLKAAQLALNKNLFLNSKDIDNYNKQMANTEILIKKVEVANAKAAQAAIALAAKQMKFEQDKGKAAAKNANESSKANKQAAKDAEKAASAYYKISQQLINQKKAVKDLLASGKELSDSDKKLIENTQELDKRLKAIDSTVGDNQRNVGAYREALNDVVAEMGAFGGVITRVARTLKELQEQGDHAQTKMQKLGNVLKAVGIGIALALVTAIIEANEAANKLSETLERNSKIAELTSAAYEKYRANLVAYKKAALTGAEGQAQSFEEATKALTALIFLEIAHDEQVRRLSIDLQKLVLDQQDFNEIAADTTIGYHERIAAQKQSMELSDKIAAKNVQIASADLTLATENLNANEKLVGVGNATKELKDALLEATLNYNVAIDKQGDLERQNATEVRKITEEKTLQEIDLLLKKKESAAAEKTLLENELKDQKIQLEERRKVAKELLSVNNKTTDEELRIFKKGFNIKFNSNELLKEQDTVILQQKILALKTLEGHGLGDAGVAELAKIIKQSQENQIDNGKTLKDLEEEEIKRKQKIAALEKEISIINLQQQDDNLKAGIEINKEKYGKNKTRKNFNNLKDSVKAEVGYQETLLREKADLDKQNVKDSVTDEKTKAEEIKKINAQLYHDLNNLKLESEKTQRELDKEYLDELKKQLKEEIDTTAEFTEQALTRKEELTSKHLDNDLEMRQRNILQQQQLAEAGYDNTLAFEKAAAAKDELAKEQLAIKQEKREKAIALIKLVSSYADKGDTDQAVIKAAVQMAIATAIAGSYFEGTENVQQDLSGNKVHSGKDGYVIAVDGSERIMTGAQNKMIGDLSNDDLAHLARNYNEGYLPGYITATDTEPRTSENTNSLLVQQFATMNGEIKEIKRALKERPVSQVNLNNLGEVVETKIRNGIIKQTTKKNPHNYL